MSIYPMPSPNGTNHERLFILRGAPQMAYDSRMTVAEARAYGERQARRLFARDGALPDGSAELPAINRDSDDPVSQLIAWCRDNLNPDECRQLAAALNDTDNMTMDNRRRQQRAHAMDSAAANDYYARFPDARRLGKA